MKKASKKGFTLIEMLLAIAITMIISGLFISLIVAIRSSYYRTYNDVDCSDIAAMYAEALENTVLYDVQHGLDDEITIDSLGYLSNSGPNGQGSINFDAIDNFNRTDGGAAGRKWDIRMLCTFNSTTGEFRYRFFFVDKYVNVDYLHYVYEGSFWIPNYRPYQSHTVGVGDVVTPSEVNGWDYNYSTGSAYPFAITFVNEGVIDANNTLTFASGNAQGGFHVRVGTTSLGELRTDPSESATVTIPQNSTVVKIDSN